ncbi:hypothetical protein HYU19_03810 [Candidatus Woesearchaeota archaeon]|nr:hypothetical protein [Candidatus Woesearchaeota archaeon]
MKDDLRLDRLIEETLRHLDRLERFEDGDIHIADHHEFDLAPDSGTAREEAILPTYPPLSSLDTAVVGRVLLLGKVTPQDTTYDQLARRYGSMERLARGLHGVDYEVIVAGSMQHALAAHQTSKIYGGFTHAVVVLDDSASPSHINELLETAHHLRQLEPALPILVTGNMGMIGQYRPALLQAKQEGSISSFFESTYLLGMVDGKQAGPQGQLPSLRISGPKPGKD